MTAQIRTPASAALAGALEELARHATNGPRDAGTLYEIDLATGKTHNIHSFEDNKSGGGAERHASAMPRPENGGRIVNTTTARGITNGRGVVYRIRAPTRVRPGISARITRRGPYSCGNVATMLSNHDLDADHQPRGLGPPAS